MASGRTAARRRLRLGVTAALLCAPAGAWGASHQVGETGAGAVSSWIGLTSSARQATLGSVIPARVAEYTCREGDLVRQGDVLVRLDGSVQEARTDIARAAAESTLEIDLAASRWAHARSELERLARLSGESSASSKELEDARHAEELSRLELRFAEFRREQARRAFDQEQRALEQFRILAPFDGYVAAHLKRVGETVDQLEGLVTLVELNPLEVILDCPLEEASSVAVGDELWVRPAVPLWAGRVGTVRLVHRVADRASQTLRVKATIDNVDLSWMAGVKVIVDRPGVSRPPENTSRAPPAAMDAGSRKQVRATASD